LVGAYHFYRLCRDGQIQAQNFIETVPKKTDSLPPVIDLEYDSTCINTYTREQLLKEIQVMHDQLYQHYGLQPIFYTSKAFYNIVLVDEFKQTPFGFVNIKASLSSKAIRNGPLATHQPRSN
jgi:lysozyme